MFKKNIKRECSMFIATGKFSLAIYMICFVTFAFLLSMLEEDVNHSVLLYSLVLSMSITGVCLIFLGIVNMAANIIGRCFKMTLKGDNPAERTLSQLLVYSVMGRKAIAPFIACATVFTIMYALNDAADAQLTTQYLVLTLVGTGAALIIVGAVSIVLHTAKAVLAWFKTHRVSLVIEKQH